MTERSPIRPSTIAPLAILVAILLGMQLLPATALSTGESSAPEPELEEAVAGFFANGASQNSPPPAGSEGVGGFDVTEAEWHLRTAAGDPTVFDFGDVGDVPIVGDWNGNDIDTVGVYDPATGAIDLRNTNDSGAADVSFSIGTGGRMPFAGDFDGDGSDSVGVYDPATGIARTYNVTAGSLTDGDAVDTISFAPFVPNRVPFAGDFNGNGTDTVAVYDPATGDIDFDQEGVDGNPTNFTYSAPTGIIFDGDWNGDGVDSPGVFAIGDITVHLRNANTAGGADISYPWGTSDWIPVAGDFGALNSSMTVTLPGAPTGVLYAVESFYLEYASAPFIAEGLRTRLAGLDDANSGSKTGTASTADLDVYYSDTSSVGVVTVGSDELFLASDDRWTWRVVGAHIVSETRQRWLGDGPRFVTVMGTDALNGDPTFIKNVTDPLNTAADSIHVYSVIPETGVGALVGLPRDTIVAEDPSSTYAPDTFYNGEQELHNVNIDNHPGLTNATIEFNTGLPIEGYFQAGFGGERTGDNFPGFLDLVDAMGGLFIEVPYDVDYQCPHQPPLVLAAETTDSITGEQALTLARQRKCTGVTPQVNGNQIRTLTQGVMMKAAIDEVQSLGIGMLPSLLDTMDDYINTDLPIDDVVQIAASVYAVDVGPIPTVTWPDLQAMGDNAYDLNPGTLPNVNIDGCVGAWKDEDGIDLSGWQYAQYWEPVNMTVFADLMDGDLDTFPIPEYFNDNPNLPEGPLFDYSCYHFTDVPPDKWYHHNVEALWDAGITTGYPDGTYRPDNNVPRLEMAPFMVRSFGETIGTCPPDPFPDVLTGSWYCGWVDKLVDEGIAEGYPDGTFQPERDLNRAEVAALIVRALGHPDPPIPTEKPFTDVETGAWYAKWVAKLKELGITNGYPDGTYRPDNTITRAEFAAILDRSFLGM